MSHPDEQTDLGEKFDATLEAAHKCMLAAHALALEVSLRVSLGMYVPQRLQVRLDEVLDIADSAQMLNTSTMMLLLPLPKSDR